jgi:hypothetical protein
LIKVSTTVVRENSCLFITNTIKQHNMATKNTTSTATSTQATPKVVCCLNCLHALLHRYGNNPILAACKCQPQPDNEQFPYAVEVACHLRRCINWKLDPDRKEVERRSKVA